MKTYKKILSFGCSFTEGNGLETPYYHQYLSSNLGNKNNLELETAYRNYMYNNSYPAYLARNLNCDFDNFAVSGVSNSLIFKKLYEKTQNVENGNDLLVTVQTTLLSRIMVYDIKQEKFLQISNFEGILDHAKKYYEMYLRYFYNKEIEFKKLLQNIDVYTKYLQSKNIDVVWLMYEAEDSLKSSKTVLTFDGTNLAQFIANQKLRLLDLPNFPVNDAHFSVDGHKVIANRIIEHLESKYD